MIKTEDMTDGLYYVKEKHGVEVGDWDSDHKKWNGIWGGDDAEILELVPSYEEWQAKLEENEKLKELLKECGRLLSFEHEPYEDEVMVKQISEVLR